MAVTLFSGQSNSIANLIFSSRIHLPTLLPDLAAGSGEGTNVSHLDHRSGEIRVEGIRILAVLLHEGVGRTAVVQDLVGVEESLLVDEVLVVLVVENGGGLNVQRGQVAVAGAGGARAAALPCFCEGRVDVGLAVDAGSEADAPCLPYCV